MKFLNFILPLFAILAQTISADPSEEHPFSKLAAKDVDEIYDRYHQLVYHFEVAEIEPAEYYCETRSAEFKKRLDNFPELKKEINGFRKFVKKHSLRGRDFFCSDLMKWIAPGASPTP